MAFKDLTIAQRLTAVHLDIMKHKDFTLMGGVTQVGKVHVFGSTTDMQSAIDALAVPTAATDGCDTFYNEEFVRDFTRQQLRYLVLHENFHKALHHCTEYGHLQEKYPKQFAMAIDYVVNDQIETIDPSFTFVARPTNCAPLIDDAFHDMSVPQVLKLLLDEEKDGKGRSPRNKPGTGPMDTHIQRTPGTGTGKEDAQSGPEVAGSGLSKEALKQQLVDAVNQGAIVQQKLRGKGGGGNQLGGFQERTTDWRTPLRRFVQEICEGDDHSRYNPLNRRLAPLGIILPSHFSESMQELLVACDTSGSMIGLYPTVFGEISRICTEAQPHSVRIIWWGDQVEGEQVFEPKDYDKLRTLMKPRGGGGTTVTCVAQYVAQKQYKPKATIMLTDGYIESQYECVPGPLLWGVVDNERFVALKGKVIHISSMDEGR